MSAWRDVLESPAHGHFVQLYSTGRPLVQSVGRYLVSGLKRRTSQLVLASQAHRQAFCTEIAALGLDPALAVKEGRLLLLDAQETLAKFMVDGQPDRRRFVRTVLDAVAQLRPAPSGVGFGAYGEMVGVLWTAGEYSAAIQLEALWNELLRSMEFSLFCAYPIDIFSEQFKITGVEALLCDHTHLLPSGDGADLNRAIDLALEDVLGPVSATLRSRMTTNYPHSWGLVPEAEGAILWIRKNLPEQAEQILHLASERYHAALLN